MDKEIHSFRDFKLNPQLLNAIEDAGYTEPTEIQKQAIPLVQNGQDLIGIAQTGTGKTAAFVLPVLKKLNYAQGNDPRCLILAPTRELVQQIYSQVEKYGVNMDLRAVVLYGGTGMKIQSENIMAGVDIIVATPGRFLDIHAKGIINAKQIKTMVLDEADKMMDMGFMPQIRRILELVPMKRQNLLFSATFPPKVVELSHEFLDFPQKVEVTPESTPVETVEQLIYPTPNFMTKIHLLEWLFQNEENIEHVIIFTRSKKSADNITSFLDRKTERKVRVIHGNKGQNTRLNAIEAFRNAEIDVLVATDVTSRGIDVKGVTHVINFEIPVIYEDYIHRIGRTGRAKQKGKAISFANDAEMMHLKEIEELIRMKIPKAKIPEGVVIEETPKHEKQEMAMEIDKIRRRKDPTFKGAFHEKKNWEDKPKFQKPKGRIGKSKQNSGRSGGKKRRR